MHPFGFIPGVLLSLLSGRTCRGLLVDYLKYLPTITIQRAIVKRKVRGSGSSLFQNRNHWQGLQKKRQDRKTGTKDDILRTGIEAFTCLEDQNDFRYRLA